MNEANKGSRPKPWPLLACLLAAGCATTQQTSGLECAAGGAAIGYLLCKAAGKSDSACAGVAAGVGAIGGAACYTYAARLEKRRQQLAGRENDLQARVQYVRGLNEDGQRLNAELGERVTVATQRNAELMGQVGRSQAAAQQLAKERQRLDGELKLADQQVTLQQNALTEVKTYQVSRRQASPDLDAEIVKQDQLLADAQRQVATLASLRERV